MVAQANPTNTALSPIQVSWVRALAKAQRLGTTPVQHGNGHYTVVGSHGDEYTVVRLTPACSAYSCTCPAGQSVPARPCYHAASVAALPFEATGRAAHRRKLAIAARAAQAA